MTDNAHTPESDMAAAAGAAEQRLRRGAAFGLSFGLMLGVVLFALTDDRMWFGIGIAFGPLLGAVITSVRWFPLDHQRHPR